MSIMNVQNDTFWKTVKIPFESVEEEQRFKRFLKSTGRSIGPYLRVIALEKVREWEEAESQNTIEA